MRAFAAVALAGLCVSGCVSMSRSAVVEPLPADWASNARVAAISLTKAAEFDLTSEFDGIFTSQVQAKLDACAKGDRPLRLEARLDRFDKANPVMTAVIAGANVLRGHATLYDVATGRKVGDYEIGSTTVGSRLAVIEMGQAEEQMSDSFGEELCEKAFPAPAAP